jgi:hypothetical protein
MTSSLVDRSQYPCLRDSVVSSTDPGLVRINLNNLSGADQVSTERKVPRTKSVMFLLDFCFGSDHHLRNVGRDTLLPCSLNSVSQQFSESFPHHRFSSPGRAPRT